MNALRAIKLAKARKVFAADLFMATTIAVSPYCTVVVTARALRDAIVFPTMDWTVSLVVVRPEVVLMVFSFRGQTTLCAHTRVATSKTSATLARISPE